MSDRKSTSTDGVEDVHRANDEDEQSSLVKKVLIGVALPALMIPCLVYLLHSRPGQDDTAVVVVGGPEGTEFTSSTRNDRAGDSEAGRATEGGQVPDGVEGVATPDEPTESAGGGRAPGETDGRSVTPADPVETSSLPSESEDELVLSLRSQLRGLESENSALSNSLSQSEARQGELEEEVERRESQADRLRDALDEANRENSDLSLSLADERGLSSRLQDALDEASRENVDLSVSLETEKGLSSTLENALAEEQGRSAELYEKLSREEARAARLEEDLSEEREKSSRLKDLADGAIRGASPSWRREEAPRRAGSFLTAMFDDRDFKGCAARVDLPHLEPRMTFMLEVDSVSRSVSDVSVWLAPHRGRMLRKSHVAQDEMELCAREYLERTQTAEGNVFSVSLPVYATYAWTSSGLRRAPKTIVPSGFQAN